MNLTSHFNNLLKEWCKRFMVPMPNLQISKYRRGSVSGVYINETRTIHVSVYLAPLARKDARMLRFMEYVLAHEFGHHVMWSGHRRSASEREANLIAKQLTGLTPKEADKLMGEYLRAGGHLLAPGIKDSEIIEDELERIEQERRLI